jgi:deoxyadenosine/deoxycytidine kinase
MRGKRNHYLSVMGTMGSGKTTAARLLATHFGYQLVEENFGENAFLPRFYHDMNRWAFHSQTFFLMEKITQMRQTELALTKESIVQDTPIIQDVFSYAKAQHMLGHMDDAEWHLYQKIYRSTESLLPKPDYIIYLETSIPVITDRIKKRGRDYESRIPISYLELLDMLIKKWLNENHEIKIITINTDNIDIVHSQKAKQLLIEIIRKSINFLK